MIIIINKLFDRLALLQDSLYYHSKPMAIYRLLMHNSDYPLTPV